MGFKKFIEKQNRSRATLSNDERSYLDKLVDIATGLYSQNKAQPTEQIIDCAARTLIELELREIEKKVQNSLLYATDAIKEKCPQLEINSNINSNGEKTDEK